MPSGKDADDKDVDKIKNRRGDGSASDVRKAMQALNKLVRSTPKVDPKKNPPKKK